MSDELRLWAVRGATKAERKGEVLVRVLGKDVSLIPRLHQLDCEVRQELNARNLRPIGDNVGMMPFDCAHG